MQPPPPQASACAAPAAYATPAALSPADAGAAGEAGAQLIISASVWLQEAKVDETRARAAAEPCPAAQIRVGGADWRLDGGDKAFVWRATSPDRSQPVAFVYPITDILEQLKAGRAGVSPSAPPSPRYLLITASGRADTLWRAYATPPSAEQVRDDLDAAMSRRSAAAARIDLDTKQVQIFVKPATKPGA